MTDRELVATPMGSQDLCNEMQYLKNALAMIEQLKGGMAARGRWGEIRKMVDALLRGVPYSCYPIGPPFSLFRGRIANEKKVLNFPHEFSYCPVECSKEYGRCHRPNSTMFYGANNLNTVLSELSPEVGDTVHVGRADVSASNKAMFTAIGEIDHVRRFNKPLIGNEESKKKLSLNGPAWLGFARLNSVLPPR